MLWLVCDFCSLCYSRPLFLRGGWPYHIVLSVTYSCCTDLNKVVMWRDNQIMWWDKKVMWHVKKVMWPTDGVICCKSCKILHCSVFVINFRNLKSPWTDLKNRKESSKRRRNYSTGDHRELSKSALKEGKWRCDHRMAIFAYRLHEWK